MTKPEFMDPHLAAYLDGAETLDTSPAGHDPTVPLFMTLPALAETLGLNYLTIYRAVRTGRIKAIHFGRTWRVPRREVQRLLTHGFETQRAQAYRLLREGGGFNEPDGLQDAVACACGNPSGIILESSPPACADCGRELSE